MNTTLTPEEKTRLEQTIAVAQARMEGKSILQRRREPIPFGSAWEEFKGTRFDWVVYDYKAPPTLVTRNWNCADDVPRPVCWLRYDSRESLITGVERGGVYCGTTFIAWEGLKRYRHSTDRKTWSPCSVEEDGQ